MANLDRIVRVVEWNIERGVEFDAIRSVFTTQPVVALASGGWPPPLVDGLFRTLLRQVAADQSGDRSPHSILRDRRIAMTPGYDVPGAPFPSVALGELLLEQQDRLGKLNRSLPY